MPTADENAAASYVATLSAGERQKLRELIKTDRAAWTEKLKAGGCTKMGSRMKVELLLEASEEAHAAGRSLGGGRPNPAPAGSTRRWKCEKAGRAGRRATVRRACATCEREQVPWSGWATMLFGDRECGGRSA